MATFITKPEIDLREELNRLKTPSGNIGAQLVRAKSVDEAHEVLGGRRNFIINGDFNFWQRRTTTAGLSLGNKFNCADRWFCYSNFADFSRNDDVPHNKGFNYSMKVSNFSGAMYLDQPIELPKLGNPWIFAPGRTITVSYWARANKPIKLLNRFMFRENAGSSSNEVSPSGMYDSAQHNELSEEWTRFTQTYTFPYFTLSSNINQLTLSIRSTDGSSVVTPTSGTEVFITGIQLELGPTASPFEFLPIETELSMCQRYFYKIGGDGSTSIGPAYTPSTGELAVSISHPVEMRVEPTVSSTSTDFSVFRFRYTANNSWPLPASATLYQIQLSKTGGSFWFQGLSHGASAPGEVRINASSGISGDHFIWVHADMGAQA